MEIDIRQISDTSIDRIRVNDDCVIERGMPGWYKIIINGSGAVDIKYGEIDQLILGLKAVKKYLE